jgi:nucleotide-binding universal stress UspA family protein
MYEEILVPTDGSQTAEAALEHAVDIAGRYGARIHALYVVDTNAYTTLETGTDVVIEALESEGELSVGRVATACEAADVPVTTAVLTGVPWRDIVEYAGQHDVDLVVMGTHGRTGIGRYLLGSVTERVVRECEVPVLTVHLAESEAE